MEDGILDATYLIRCCGGLALAEGGKGSGEPDSQGDKREGGGQHLAEIKKGSYVDNEVGSE